MISKEYSGHHVLISVAPPITFTNHFFPTKIPHETGSGTSRTVPPSRIIQSPKASPLRKSGGKLFKNSPEFFSNLPF
jgi:hypothetical protein